MKQQIEETKELQSILIKQEIENLTLYIENLQRHIDNYQEQLASLQTAFLAQKQIEEEAKKQVDCSPRQASPKDPFEQEWKNLLEEDRQEIIKFIELRKVTQDIQQLQEVTCFSRDEIETLLAIKNDDQVPEVASHLLGIPFNVCEEWPLLAAGSETILPEVEN
jgi:hypothetical protein